ncbi:PAS domain S-box protein [Myxococcota bacterium]|nr:PAS domain S-box protein [Myxococcota bacterium]
MNVVLQSLRCGAISVTIREPDAPTRDAIEALLLVLAERDRAAVAADEVILGEDTAPTLDLSFDLRPVLVLGPTAGVQGVEAAILGAPRRPVIVLHRADDVAMRSEALRFGADDVAPWPLGADDLMLSIQLAVERRRQREDYAQAQRDLSALFELSESLTITHDISGTLLEICVRVAEVMQADRCSIVLLDDEAQHGFVVAASDDSSLKNHRIDIAKYPEIREVVRTGAPLVIDDIESAPIFDSVRETLRGKPVASTTIFPVRIDRRVQGVLMLRERAVRTRGLAQREIRYGRIVANATATAIRNARLYEMIRDTSERRLSERIKAERRLRQIEKYQRFFDFAGDGLMIVDGTARILFANRAARAILGFEAAALSRITLYDIVEPRDRKVLDDVMEAVRHGEHQSSRDLSVVLASGVVATLSMTAASLDESRDGDLAGGPGDTPTPVPRPGSQSGRADVTAILSFRDVTATRQMQEELRRTKDFLLNLIESSADAIVAADIEGKVIIFNKVAERITGYPASKVLGSNVSMLYPPGVAREIMNDLRAPANGGVGKLLDRRQNLVTAGGELVPINLAASIVYDEGREVASVGIFSDLRERLRMEEAVLKAQRQLELSERQSAIVELAGAAAHELNQPLTTIMGSAELAQRKVPKDSPAMGSLRMILSEAERMAEIVRKLGQITKYETKPYVGASKIVDLDAASKERKE